LCQKLLRDARFHAFLLEADRGIAAEARECGCRRCAGVVHVADFPRKPRGEPPGLEDGYERRCSFCCAEEDCRKRRTPPSLRFLGRKVYFGAVVTLVSAMRHGASPARMRRLRELVGVSRRTLERWRAWWRTTFVESPFWRAAAPAFMPPVADGRLPAALLERFAGDETSRLVSLLRFLGPITEGAAAVHAP
jgi:hypothetical protein